MCLCVRQLEYEPQIECRCMPADSQYIALHCTHVKCTRDCVRACVCVCNVMRAPRYAIPICPFCQVRLRILLPLCRGADAVPTTTKDALTHTLCVEIVRACIMSATCLRLQQQCRAYVLRGCARVINTRVMFMYA